MSLDLTAMRARCDKATKGPWRVQETSSNGCATCPNVMSDKRWIATLVGAPYIGYEDTMPNADFIAHARADLPALLALVEEQRLALHRIQAMCGCPNPADGCRYILAECKALLAKCGEE